jgi:hypothetical protein
MRDITDILNGWPYDPGSSVRKLQAEDGRELIQVRTPLGIEQYEMTGRPDGARPYGCESALEYVEGLAARHEAEEGTRSGFAIDEGLASELQQEGLIYYYRYLVCFQIGEYERVAQDAARNLRMSDVLAAYCDDESVVHESEQYRPYVLRMNAAARALMAVGREEYRQANAIIDESIRRIESLPEVPTATFGYEKKRSLAILRGMRRAIPKPKPLTPADKLRQELQQAVSKEQYERAAEIRDRLRTLSQQPRGEVADAPDRE